MIAVSASVLVTGGGRSGKSRYAIARALRSPAPRAFIATAERRDAEMEARIAAHRAERGSAFRTVEEPRDVASALARLSPASGVVIVDCVTLWIANLLATDPADAAVEHAIDDLAAAVAAGASTVVLVTNEVGAGIIPFDTATRRFRDLLGVANQRLAAVVDELVLMVAGVPLVVKAPR